MQIGRVENGGLLSVMEHKDTVTHAQKFGQIAGSHDHAAPISAELAHQAVDLEFRAYIDTAGGFVQKQQPRCFGQCPGKLRIPANPATKSGSNRPPIPA